MKNALLCLVLTAGLSNCQKDQPAPTPMPVAGFNYSIGNTGVSERTVYLINTSKNAVSFQWIANTLNLTDKDAAFKVTANGRYNVSLTAKNSVGQDTQTQSIDVTDIPTSGSIVFWSQISNYGSITVNVNAVYQGKLTKYITGSTAPACNTDGFVTVTLPAGIYAYTAKSEGLLPLSWSGSFTVVNGVCKTFELSK